LTCCVRKDRRLNTDLRFALVSELAHVPGPTDTYGPHCMLEFNAQAECWNVTPILLSPRMAGNGCSTADASCSD